MARRAALPYHLQGLSEALKLEQGKSTRGKALIRKFSLPRKPTRNDGSTRHTGRSHPEEFGEFLDYCLQDVRAEQEVHTRLSSFELEGDILDGFRLDLKMNTLGVPVNREALENARGMLAKSVTNPAGTLTTSVESSQPT